MTLSEEDKKKATKLRDRDATLNAAGTGASP
jgi:hypothetical protein